MNLLGVFARGLQPCDFCALALMRHMDPSCCSLLSSDPEVLSVQY